MTKVNGNGGEKQNIDALKAYYEALSSKRAKKPKQLQNSNQKALKQAHLTQQPLKSGEFNFLKV